MTADLFFNHFSLPAKSSDDARAKLLDMYAGLSALIQNKRCNHNWLAQINIEEVEFAPGYMFAHFRADVAKNKARDTLILLGRLALRYPFRDRLSKEDLQTFDRTDAIPCAQPELGGCSLLAAAHIAGGIVLSLSTSPTWDNSNVPITLIAYDEEMNEISREHNVKVLHLSRAEHVRDIEVVLKAQEGTFQISNWNNVLPQWHIHQDFYPWLASQSEDIVFKVMSKAHYVQEKNFDAGFPTVSKVYGSKFADLKELRITVGGGSPLRIIFRRKSDGIGIMLTGDYKGDYKDESDFYKKHIEIAESRS